MELDKKQVRELSAEEMKSFTADIDALLLKHNCEIGVSSTIQIVKRIEEIKSPFMKSKDENSNPKTE